MGIPGPVNIVLIEMNEGVAEFVQTRAQALFLGDADRHHGIVSRPVADRNDSETCVPRSGFKLEYQTDRPVLRRRFFAVGTVPPKIWIAEYRAVDMNLFSLH